MGGWGGGGVHALCKNWPLKTCNNNILRYLSQGFESLSTDDKKTWRFFCKKLYIIFEGIAFGGKHLMFHKRCSLLYVKCKLRVTFVWLCSCDESLRKKKTTLPM